MSSGRLYIVAAPSGGGKTSLVHAVLQAVPKVALSISHTTRQPRPGEVDQEDYFFVSEAEFEEIKTAGGFLESAVVYGYHYGTTKAWVAQCLESGVDVILEIDWQGAEQIKQLFPEALSIYILPPSLAVLKQRLMGRKQDAPEVIAQRLAQAQSDISHAKTFDYWVINDRFEQAVVDLTDIIMALRSGKAPKVARDEALLTELISNTLP